MSACNLPSSAVTEVLLFALCSIRRLVECRRERFIDGLTESSKYGVVVKVMVMATNLCVLRFFFLYCVSCLCVYNCFCSLVF